MHFNSNRPHENNKRVHNYIIFLYFSKKLHTLDINVKTLIIRNMKYIILIKHSNLIFYLHSKLS